MINLTGNQGSANIKINGKIFLTYQINKDEKN